MRETIKAGNGFILTNGEIYGTTILLADSASKTDFYEIPFADYEAMMADEAAEASDYQAALAEFGVKI